jgi:hypothetical protein
MTSTPRTACVPVPTTHSGEPLAAADRFLALVEQTRAAVQASLAADAATRARRAEAEHAQPSGDAHNDGTEDAAVPSTQLEQLVSGLLGGRDVAWTPVRIVG